MDDVVAKRSEIADEVREFEIKASDFFAIGPGHDCWVVGDEPYVSLHFLGAAAYAR